MSNKNKIVVTGGSGRFAKTLKKLNVNMLLFIPKKTQLNICNLNSMRKYLKKISAAEFCLLEK